ncbi:MAG: hypothetical protein AAB131_12650 [Actinomycetota bacterium]|jgi:predicted GH43/DUF377 family glycosyl hydrolase
MTEAATHNSGVLTAPMDLVDVPFVQRASAAPVVAAGSVAGYGPIFNAGLLHHDGRFHLFARAVRDIYRPNTGPGPRFIDYVSDIVVFESSDGLQYEFGYVLARAGEFGVACFEDPRVQVIRSRGCDRHVMTYTNLPQIDGRPWRVGAHHLVHDGDRFHLDPSSGRLLGPDGIHDKDAVVYNLTDGRVALLHRIYPDVQLAIFDDLEHLWDADATYWDEHLADIDRHTVIRPSPGALGVGAGAPPVRTAAGLLLFFHERRGDGAYTMNLALLDENSGRPISVLPEAVLVPELSWEIEGDVDNVIFVQGAHLEPDGDTIYLVYGAADRHVGAARASARHLLSLLRRA